jgi:Holliday junction resolvase RusA-like endonuclease
MASAKSKRCESCRPQSFVKSAAQIRRDASDAQILAARFPNMSRSTREANSLAQIQRKENVGLAKAMEIQRAANQAGLVLRITGIIRGGKNNMIVCRNGAHIPRASWKLWRDDAVEQIKRQLPPFYVPISEPCNVRLDYVAGDKRRRDFPAIVDAIWHVLERCAVVRDDALLWVSESSRSYDKAAPSCTITFL